MSRGSSVELCSPSVDIHSDCVSIAQCLVILHCSFQNRRKRKVSQTETKERDREIEGHRTTDRRLIISNIRGERRRRSRVSRGGNQIEQLSRFS